MEQTTTIVINLKTGIESGEAKIENIKGFEEFVAEQFAAFLLNSDSPLEISAG